MYCQYKINEINKTCFQHMKKNLNKKETTNKHALFVFN